ncbi:Uu.00g114650.m01.CDS01 [Anthostomella pinea]|uniref:Uu.00g114650.m01.CDS01 n=1 Tax=Anthostomella pinea TaxID=933095 RepID=A0AAI8VG78_9PEZI|nr:Uu.00g114650.m01.CDS01 [Anthostomella pinea]
MVSYRHQGEAARKSGWDDDVMTWGKSEAKVLDDLTLGFQGGDLQPWEKLEHSQTTWTR